MPFANKFRFVMGLPNEGYVNGRFTVEACEVGHNNIASSIYEDPVEIIVSGKGGQQGVRNDLKGLLTSRHSAFSGFGTPYQFHFERAEIVLSRNHEQLRKHDLQQHEYRKSRRRNRPFHVQQDRVFEHDQTVQNECHHIMMNGVVTTMLVINLFYECIASGHRVERGAGPGG